MRLSPLTKIFDTNRTYPVLPIAVVVLHAHSKEFQVLKPLLPVLEKPLASLKPRCLAQVGS